MPDFKIAMMRFLFPFRFFCWLLLLTGAASGHTRAQTYYVSPGGSDTNAGTLQAPFATLTRAREAVRRHAGGQKPVTVYLRGGRYYLQETIGFDARDGGSPQAPVTYRAYGSEKPVLCGARPIPVTAIRPVTDAAVLARIQPSLRTKIRSIDLSNLQITHARRFPDLFTDDGGLVTLFIDGQRMPLSRYPNKGYMTMKRVLINGGGQETKEVDWRTFYANGAKTTLPPRPGLFEYRDVHTARWVAQLQRGVWLKGYWRIPWQNETVRIGAIDTVAHTITTAVPVPGGIGNKYTRPEGNGKEPYYLLNLLEEIDMPGEWAVDFDDRKLYFYPPEGSKDIRLADLSDPLIRLDGVSDIILRGLTFEESMGDAIQIKGGSTNLVAGCTVHAVNQYAVRIDGGTGHAVQSCDLFDLGAGGVWLAGGNETSVPRQPAGHRVINNHIHHFGVLTRVYAPAINSGYTGGGGGGHHPAVGMYIAHNLIHDTPHAGVLFGSWDSVFEYNEIFRMCLVSNDMGGFYAYDQYGRMGNHTFAYNFIHSSAEGDGIYFDHDHRDMHVHDNILLLNSAPKKRGTGFLYKIGSQDKHPQTLDCYNNIAINCNYGFQFVTVRGSGNRIENNVAVHSAVPFTYHEILNGKEVATDSSLASGRNAAYQTDPGFADLSRFDFTLKPGSPLLKDLPGFKPIPFRKIGLYIDEYRTRLPTDEETGRFRGNQSDNLQGEEILDRN